MGSVGDLNKRKVNSMDIYTVTLQFRVLAGSKDGAERLAEMTQYNLPSILKHGDQNHQGLREVLAPAVHFYAGLNEEGE